MDPNNPNSQTHKPEMPYLDDESVIVVRIKSIQGYPAPVESRIKMILKRLFRTFGMKCLSARKESPEETARDGRPA